MTFPYWIPFENEWWTFASLLFLILGIVGISDFIHKKDWISPDANRKWVHFLVGMFICISPMIFPTNLRPITLSIIFIFLNAYALRTGLFKGIHNQDRFSYGTIYFPIAYFLLVLFFWDYPELIILSFLVLAISDPLASQVGQHKLFQSKFKIWVDEKTVQGTIAFFSSAFIIIFLGAHSFFDNSNNYLFGLALFTALGATIAETTSCRGTDNISIPIVCLLFMIGYFNHVSESGQFFELTVSSSSILLFIVILLLFVAYYYGSLSRSGFYGALIMGIIVTLIGSWRFLLPLAAFFILSSLLSKIVKNTSFYQTKGSTRDIVQVYANGGIALLICIFDFIQPNDINFFLFLASVSAAMSDTWATEIGKISKKRPISIINFIPMDHGLSGGITRIGIIGSLLGSSLFGLTIWCVIPMPPFKVYGIILCGLFGSVFDSFLGATIQAKYETQTGEIIESYQEGANFISGISYVNNDMVNLMNTAFAPILMYFYLKLF